VARLVGSDPLLGNGPGDILAAMNGELSASSRDRRAGAVRVIWLHGWAPTAMISSRSSLARLRGPACALCFLTRRSGRSPSTWGHHARVVRHHDLQFRGKADEKGFAGR